MSALSEEAEDGSVRVDVPPTNQTPTDSAHQSRHSSRDRREQHDVLGMTRDEEVRAAVNVFRSAYDSPVFRGGSPIYSPALEGPNPPCPGCSRNVPCMFFYGQVVFSVLILAVAVAGLAGFLGADDGCFNNSFYSNLITMIVALWIGRSTGGLKTTND
jgi:hypothetical protein